MPLTPSSSGSGSTKKHLLRGALILVPTLLVIALGVGIGVSHSHRHSQDTAAQSAAHSTSAHSSPTDAAQKWCTPHSGNPYVSSKGGDTSTPEGILATMEQQYFGARSADGVMALVGGDWTDINDVSNAIAGIPTGSIEWCTTIRPAESGWYTVIVDSRKKNTPDDVTTWVGDYHVETIPGEGLRIIDMRPNPTVVQELKHKELKRKEADAGA